MKIVFLDIDGVLNWAGSEERLGMFVGLCKTRIQRLNRLFEIHLDARIVVSSTWRKTGLFGVYEDFDGLIKLLADHGLKATIIDHTPIHFGHRPRGHEIKEWLAANQDKWSSFVVLDDDTEGMEGSGVLTKAFDPNHMDLRPHHVITHYLGDPAFDSPEGLMEEGGLQERHIDIASKILKGELS